jgi:hypothetical protein
MIMKKTAPFVFLSAVCLLLIMIVYGCGSSSSSSTTTTNGTVGATESATAKSGVLVASGGASVGIAASAVGGSAGTSPKVYAVSDYAFRSPVKAFMGNPPPAFFTLDMTTGTASIDGYFMPLSAEALGGKVTPYIRLRNVSGEVITGAFFAGKKIADLSPCSVEAIFAGSPTKAPDGIISGMTNFITKAQASDPTAYTAIKYMGDYLCWAYIFPTIEVIANSSSTHPPLPVHLTKPLATHAEMIGSMDNKMVFTGLVTGETLVNVPCELDGRASLGTSSGTGKLLTPVGTMDVTTSITFTVLGDPPTSVKVVGTNEATPFYTTIVNITSPTTGVGTGEIWDFTASPEALIGTIKTSAGGGSVTIGLTTESFTF